MIKIKQCNHTKGSKFRGDAEPVEFWGRVWEGYSTLTQGVFAFWGLKVSDLVHTFGEFVGILSIPKLIGKYTFTKYASSSSRGVGLPARERIDRAGEGVGRGIPPPKPGSFCILRIQCKRSGACFW